jgi:hypothetical protein
MLELYRKRTGATVAVQLESEQFACDTAVIKSKHHEHSSDGSISPANSKICGEILRQVRHLDPSGQRSSNVQSASLPEVYSSRAREPNTTTLVSSVSNFCSSQMLLNFSLQESTSSFAWDISASCSDHFSANWAIGSASVKNNDCIHPDFTSRPGFSWPVDKKSILCVLWIRKFR